MVVTGRRGNKGWQQENGHGVGSQKRGMGGRQNRGTVVVGSVVAIDLVI